MAKYIDRRWLNSENSHYTGTIVAHDGCVSNREQPVSRYAFLEIADCHKKIKIHMDKNLPREEYLDKILRIKDVVDKYVEHLRQNLNNPEYDNE